MSVVGPRPHLVRWLSWDGGPPDAADILEHQKLGIPRPACLSASVPESCEACWFMSTCQIPGCSCKLCCQRRLADDAPPRERLGKAVRFYAEQHLDKEWVLTRFLEKLRLVCDGVD